MRQETSLMIDKFLAESIHHQHPNQETTTTAIVEAKFLTHKGADGV